MHHVLRAADIRLEPTYPAHSAQFTRCAMIDRAAGSVHKGFGACALGAGGPNDTPLATCEERL